MNFKTLTSYKALQDLVGYDLPMTSIETRGLREIHFRSEFEGKGGTISLIAAWSSRRRDFDYLLKKTSGYYFSPSEWQPIRKEDYATHLKNLIRDPDFKASEMKDLSEEEFQRIRDLQAMI